MLHLERNAISKIEPTGLLSSIAPNLRELYLTNNTIASVAKGALDSASLGILHLDSNHLTEVPTRSLSGLPNLEELSLSQNSINQVGPKAFHPISQSLKRLYLDQMGMEKVQHACGRTVLSYPTFSGKNYNLALRQQLHPLYLKLMLCYIPIKYPSVNSNK